MPIPDNSQADEITAAEAAEILGTGRRQVIRLVGRGNLTFTRKLPGQTGSYLFRRAEIEALRDALAGGVA